MHVLQIISSMDPKGGGPVEGIHNSIPSLQALGVSCEVICLDDPTAEHNTEDFRVHRIGSGKGPWHYNPELPGWLKQNVNRFDLIIIHGLWLYHGYATHRFLRKQKQIGAKSPKYFVFPHGMLDPWFQTAPGRTVKAIRNWIYWKSFESKIINDSDGIIFTSEEERRLAATTFQPYLPKAEIKLGYGILGPPPYKALAEKEFRNSIHLADDKPFLLFLGRIHEKKGLDLLIKAYLVIQKTQKDLPALVITGPGLSTHYGRTIIKLANTGRDIYFSGFLSGDEKWAAMHACEAFILPSHQENFGIAVVEALACGKPVLISNKINIWEKIQSAGAGIIGNDSIDSTISTMNKWVKLSPDVKKQMSINAKKCFQDNFTVEQSSRQFLQTINNVID